MTYTTPKTWRTTDGTPTHDEFNAALVNNPLSLRSLNDHAAEVYRTSNQSIPNATETIVLWSGTQWQNGSSVWAGADPTRLKAPVTGIYLFSARAAWASNNVGERSISYRISGGAALYDMQWQTAQPGATRQNAAELIQLAANEYLEMRVRQDSGGALNLLGGGRGDSVASLELIGTQTDTPLWTDPRTWSTGDVFTPWKFNTDWRDNQLNLRYLKGQAAKVCLLDEPMSVASDDRTVIAWTQGLLQLGSVWDSGSQLKAPIAGWYMLLVILEWDEDVDAPGTSRRGVGYRISGNGTNYDLQFQSGGNTRHNTNGKALIRLEQDDYIEIYGYQDSGQSISLNCFPDRTRASLHLVATD